MTSLKTLNIIDVIYSPQTLDDNDEPVSKMLEWDIVDFNETNMIIHTDFENPLLVSLSVKDTITVRVNQPGLFLSQDGRRNAGEEVMSLRFSIPKQMASFEAL